MKRLLTSAVLFLSTLMTFAQFSGSGSGTQSDPYLIFNPIQLNQLRNFLDQSNVYFKLMSDIDLTGFLEDENPNQGWQPIGSSISSPFRGVLDGNNKTISGLWINRNASYIGLFGYTFRATIKNLKIEAQTVSGKTKVGGLCGYNHSSNITNCSFTGKVQGDSIVGGLFGACFGKVTLSYLSGEVEVNGSEKKVGGIVGEFNTTSDSLVVNNSRITNSVISGKDYVGGLCGYGSNLSLKKCNIYADIQGNDYVGGICGYNDANLKNQNNIISCGHFGSISGRSNIGGLVGYCYIPQSKNKDNRVNISQSYSIGNIKASGGNVGGILGYAKGNEYYSNTTNSNYYSYCTITSSYHSGNVSSASSYVGGIAGYKYYGEISQCYAKGDVSGTNYVGGLAGFHNYGKIKRSVAICDRVSASNGNYAYRICKNDGVSPGSTDENKAYNRTVIICNNVEQNIEDNINNGTGVGNTTLKLKATYVALGFDFNDTWAIQETECYPYMKSQTAPPVFDSNSSNLVSGQTTISGNAADGGTIYIDVDGKKQETVSSGYKWSFTVAPLQAGETVSVSAKANNKEMSYYISEVVGFLGGGTETNPYRIYTADDLQGAINKGYYALMNDIDLTTWINTNSPTEGWIPVGSDGCEAIQFNGNGHKITGLCTTSNNDNIGLFSDIYGGSIKDLEVVVADNKQIKGRNNVGILVGKMAEGNIKNCSVRGSLNYGTTIGGLVGKFDGGNISSCTAQVIITTNSPNNSVGGITGELVGKITQSKADVDIKTNGQNTYVGGIVGTTSGLSSEVYNSLSTGIINAKGTTSYAAGITGRLGLSGCPSYIENCYSTATITSSYSAAGVAAYSYGGVTKCYASGDINSSNFGAGIVGYNDGTYANVAKCVALNNIINVTFESQSSQSGGYGQRILGGFKNGASTPQMNNYALNTMQVSLNNLPQIVYDDPLNGTSKTSDELKQQSTYEALDWVFPGIWSMNTYTGLPYLKWNKPEGTEQTLSLSQLPTMTYGDDAYQLPTNTDQGLPLTWISNDPSIVIISGTVLTIRKAGAVVVSAVQGGNGDYYPFSKSFSLTINKANLCITADSYTIRQGDELPELTVNYEGFKYNDDASCLTTLPKVTTTATSTSPVGDYPIVVSDAEADNYVINYVNGTLTVVDASLPGDIYSTLRLLRELIDRMEVLGGYELDVANAIADRADVTKEEMEECIAQLQQQIKDRCENAREDSLPVDATGLITNPTFTIDNAAYWQGDSPQCEFEGEYNQNAEFYERTFDFYQELTGLPNGLYLLKVKGFHRPGSNGDVYNDYQQGVNNASVQLYGNNQWVTLENQARYAQDEQIDGWCGEEVSYNGRTQYVPNYMRDAKIWFSNGYYENILPVFVTDHTLRLGLRLDEWIEAGWVIFDDFRLEYHGNKSADTYYTLMLLRELIARMEVIGGYELDAANATADRADATKAELDKCIAQLQQQIKNRCRNAGNDNLPVDATGLIINPTFSINNAAYWQGDSPQCDIGNGEYNQNAEFFERVFDTYQELTGLPNGLYLLKVKGFHRPGPNGDVYSDYQQGINNATAQLYGNNQSVTLENQARYAQDEQFGNWCGVEVSYNGKTQYVPNTMHDAKVWFNHGYYENELPVFVTDGILRLGLRLDEWIETGWVIFDDFRLEYLGDTFNNTLSSDPVEIRTGDNASISLELINEDPIIMVEFYMQLPEGICISVDEDGFLDATLNSSRSNRHSIDVEKNSDGFYHFLVYSSKNNSFKGNEGELISINVECDENMESGTYQATLRNILLNNADKEEIVLPDYSFPIHVTDVLLGDVNGDTKINGSDIVELVDYIMGRESDRFIPAAAELTGDGEINGSDLVEEISLVMTQSVSQASSRTGNNAPSFLSSGLTLKGNSTGTAVLGVESDESFILSQLLLELSEGQHLTDITTDAHHSVEYRQLSENTYCVLCYSTSNAIFSSNAALLTIHYIGQGVISVKNAMVVDNNREEWYFSPVSLDDATGIDWFNRSLCQPADIYSINGYLVRQQASSLEGLTKGVYIIDGNKIIIK